MAETEEKARQEFTEEQKMVALWDAARLGIPEAAKMHGIKNEANIYRWGYERPDLWKTLKARLKPVRELDNEELLSKVSGELKSRFNADSSQFKPGELVSIYKACWSARERMDRMDQYNTSISALLLEIKVGNQKVVSELLSCLKEMSPKEFDKLIADWEKEIDRGAEEGSGSEQDKLHDDS